MLTLGSNFIMLQQTVNTKYRKVDVKKNRAIHNGSILFLEAHLHTQCSVNNML